MDPPILVYYEIQGWNGMCPPHIQALEMVDGKERSDCLFNDLFALSSGLDSRGDELIMMQEGISSQNDLQLEIFRQPEGFRWETCPGDVSREEACQSDAWSCLVPYLDPVTGLCFRYHYPNDGNITYPYETYPNIISPIEGMQNEHYMVWNRCYDSTKVRLLYGWINQAIRAGERLIFRVEANWALVGPGIHNRSKSFIVSNLHAGTFANCRSGAMPRSSTATVITLSMLLASLMVPCSY